MQQPASVLNGTHLAYTLCSLNLPQRREFPVDLFAMKAIQVLLFAVVLSASAQAKSQVHYLDQVTSRAFLEQLIADRVYLFISSDYAKSLLVHRAEPELPTAQQLEQEYLAL